MRSSMRLSVPASRSKSSPVPRRYPPREVAFDDRLRRADDRIDASEEGVADQRAAHDAERPGNADRP